MERNHYIDFCRGLANISVILIHTAFWSGQNYVPDFVRNIVLLLDVPVFFFLAGATLNKKVSFYKRFYSILGLWTKWVYFICIITICCLIIKCSGALSIFDFMRNLFFSISFESIPLLKGSVWFLPVYIQTVLISDFFMEVLRKTIDGKNDIDYEKKLIFCVYGIIVILHSLDLECNVSVYIAFYGIFYILGICLFQKCWSAKRWSTLLFSSMILSKVCAYSFGKSLRDIQNLKFPPHIVYLFISLISIFVIMLFKEHYKSSVLGRWIEHLGKRSIWCYFAQTISSSLCYYVVLHIKNIDWQIKFFIVFLINMCIMIIIEESLYIGYHWIMRMVKSFIRH